MEVTIFPKSASVLVFTTSMPLFTYLAWAGKLSVILLLLSVFYCLLPAPTYFLANIVLSWICLYSQIYLEYVYIFEYILNRFPFLFPHGNCPSSSSQQLCLNLPRVLSTLLRLLHNVTKRIFLEYKSSEITPLFKTWSSSTLRIMCLIGLAGPAWFDLFAVLVSLGRLF